MYWFNLKALETQIGENRLSGREALSYLIAYTLLINFIVYLESDLYSDIYLWGIFPILLLIFAAIRLNYNAYTNHGGKDFFKIYWAINWVIGIRLVSLTVALILTLFPLFLYLIMNSSYAESITHFETALNKQGFNLVMEFLFTIIFYFLMNRSLKRVALGKPLN